ncbi:MAG: DUF2878 domain-containing protein [Methylococcales bacterium]
MYLKPVNFIAFQFGWLACVLGGAHGWPWLGVALSLPILTWHFIQAESVWREACLLMLIAVSGGMLDQCLLGLGLVGYPGANGPVQWLPPWMWMLWMLFASTLNVSLRWLRKGPQIGALLGFLGGPLAYWGASRLGAVDLLGGAATLAAIGLVWAAAVPAMIWLSRRLDGYAGLDSSHEGLSHV